MKKNSTIIKKSSETKHIQNKPNVPVTTTVLDKRLTPNDKKLPTLGSEACIEKFLGFFEDFYEKWDNEILVVSEKELSTINNVFKGLNLKNNNFCKILANLPKKQPQKKYIFETYVLDIHKSESDVPKFFILNISKVEEPFLIPVRIFKEVLNALRKTNNQSIHELKQTLKGLKKIEDKLKKRKK